MLIRKKNNRGFTLVEVIVSMLVLSITIVSVLSAFTLSAKSNMRTKKLQAAESLMEDLSEYVAAGGRDYTYFGTVNSVEDPSDSNKRNITITGANKGFYEYEVKIVENKAPTKYTTTEANDYEVFSFGGEGTNAIVIDASKDGMSVIEDNALAYYMALHETEVIERNAEIEAMNSNPEATPMPTFAPAPPETIKSSIARQLKLETADDGGKLVVKATAEYKMVGTILFPSGSENFSQEFYVSDKYDKSSGTGSDKLNQIYMLYSDSATAIGDGTAALFKDVYIYDAISELDASLFLVNQETTVKNLDSSSIDSGLYDNIGSRVGSTQQIDVNVDGVPQRLDIYCSDKVGISGSSTNVTPHDNTLIAGAKETRVVEISIQIIDPETGAVLMSDSDVYLQ